MVSGVPTTGDIIAGKYRVERVLGKGGMGVVVAAEHLHLRERVALKLMLPEVAHDPTALARFVREGRSMVRIKSEHVVRILDVGTTDAGLPFLVMEHLDGADLADVLAHKGPLPVRDAVDYLLQAILALSEAHALGIVHRDLKPTNLFLTTRRDGTSCVKVLDFGIATGERGGSRGLTATGLLVGSPQYMSPEQLFGNGRVDARADIWALGCVLYELVTAAVPFEAVSLPDLLIKVQGVAPTPIASRVATVPVGVDAIVMKCLEKDAARRFADVSVLAAALAPFGSEGALETASRVARVLKSDPRVVVAGARFADAGMATLAMTPTTAPALSVTADDPAFARPRPRTGLGMVAVAVAGLVVLLLVGGTVLLATRRASSVARADDGAVDAQIVLATGATSPSGTPTPDGESPALLPLDVDARAAVGSGAGLVFDASAPKKPSSVPVSPSTAAPAPQPPAIAPAPPAGNPADFRRR